MKPIARPPYSNGQRRAGRRSRCPEQRGAVLVEFAMVAFILYLLLGVLLDFGRLMYCAQVLQQAASVGAAELGKMTLPATYSFEDAMKDPDVQSQIFDERFLVIDLDDLAPGETTVEYAQRMPLINRLLYPLMISDPGRNIVRYPGALVWRFDPNGGGGYPTVLIPEVVVRTSGAEVINLRKVVEEVKVDGRGSFSVTADGEGVTPGRVRLRVNYPYQAATLSAYEYTDEDGNPIDGIPVGEDVINIPIEADDGSVIVQEQPGGYTLVGNGSEIGPYSGAYGLGRQYALKRELRPFSKLLVQLGERRRETFSR